MDGILAKIKEFKNNDLIFGIVDTVIIQPCVPRNSQVSIVCFNGKAVVRNPNKKGSRRSSPFQHSKTELFFRFAETAIERLKEIIDDQVIRVDIHGIQHHGQLLLLVNNMEGFETRIWGGATGKGARDVECLKQTRKDYWYSVIDTLVECHVQRTST